MYGGLLVKASHFMFTLLTFYITNVFITMHIYSSGICNTHDLGCVLR